MNKLLINICIVLLSGCIYAMDEGLRFQLNAQKSYGATQQVSQIRKIQKCQDISLIPLKGICKNIAALSPGLQAKIKQDLSQSWIFNVAMLLPEIKNKIILKMAENHEKVAQYLYEGPMLSRFAVYHDNWNSCFMTVGGKEFSGQQVFMLPSEHKEVFIKLTKPSLARYMNGQFNSSTITFEDAQELEKLPRELLGNMKLTALIPEPEVATKTRKIFFYIGCLLLAADAIGGTLYVILDDLATAKTLFGILSFASIASFSGSGMTHCIGTSLRHEHAQKVNLNELGQVVVEQ